MGFDGLVNIIVLIDKSTKKEHFDEVISGSQIIYKPGSVIEDVISLDLNSRLSSSG